MEIFTREEWSTTSSSWDQTLPAVPSQQWDQGEVSLLNLQRMNPDCYLYKLYANEVAAKRRNPPPANWDASRRSNEKVAAP